MQAKRVVRAAAQGECQVRIGRKNLSEAHQVFVQRVVGLVWQQDCDQAFRMGGDVVPV